MDKTSHFLIDHVKVDTCTTFNSRHWSLINLYIIWKRSYSSIKQEKPEETSATIATVLVLYREVTCMVTPVYYYRHADSETVPCSKFEPIHGSLQPRAEIVSKLTISFS